MDGVFLKGRVRRLGIRWLGSGGQEVVAAWDLVKENQCVKDLSDRTGLNEGRVLVRLLDVEKWSYG